MWRIAGGVTEWFKGIKSTLYHVDVYEATNDFPPNENSVMKKVWDASYAQGDACFAASVPGIIPKEELAKYLEMEKVIIE